MQSIWTNLEQPVLFYSHFHLDSSFPLIMFTVHPPINTPNCPFNLFLQIPWLKLNIFKMKLVILLSAWLAFLVYLTLRLTLSQKDSLDFFPWSAVSPPQQISPQILQFLPPEYLSYSLPLLFTVYYMNDYNSMLKYARPPASPLTNVLHFFVKVILLRLSFDQSYSCVKSFNKSL